MPSAEELLQLLEAAKLWVGTCGSVGKKYSIGVNMFYYPSGAKQAVFLVPTKYKSLLIAKNSLNTLQTYVYLSTGYYYPFVIIPVDPAEYRLVSIEVTK